MIEDVTLLLASFGYTVIETDAWMLNFIISKVETKIKKECGAWDSSTSSMIIPDDLHNVAVDIVVGEFLLAKKSSGQLTGINLSAAVKSIQEGDTNVAFTGVKSNEERIDILIMQLLSHDADLVSHRKILW